MNCYYEYEIGVKPWEEIPSLSNNNFSTISIVGSNIDSLSKKWRLIINTLNPQIKAVYKWRSLGYKIEGSKVQELKVIKELNESVPEKKVIKKNTDTGILSYIEYVPEPLGDFDLSTITQGRYTCLLLYGDEPTEMDAIWKSCKKADSGMTVKLIEKSIESSQCLFFCRMFESHDHSCVQYIGTLDNIDNLLYYVEKLGIERRNS